MMWTAGDVSAVEYQDGYYRESNPAALWLACLNMGKKLPKDRATHVCDSLAAQGQRIIRDGKGILKQAVEFSKFADA